MAVKKKQAKQEEGAPAWMVTYGDMVTLLLTFFVLLLAMSEVKKEDEFLDFMQAIREAFGYQGGVRPVPIDEVQMPRNVDYAVMTILPVDPHDFSKARTHGVAGDEPNTQNIRQGDVYVVGGRIQFPTLSAELSESEATRIPQLATQIRGLTTQIRVSGHCSRRPVDDTPFVDHMDLAFQRARVVQDALIRHGVAPERILIEAAGTNRPVAVNAYTAAEMLQNDVVEILQIDVRVDEFIP